MLIGFFDDTDLLVDDEDKKPDIFVYGGYFIDQARLAEFQARIVQIKESYGLIWHAPVKWNMRDTALRQFYDEDHWLGQYVFDLAWSNSVPIRRDLLALLGEFDATVMVSARYDKSKNPEELATYSTWAFENLLQRMGMMAQSRYPNKDYPGFQIVADWPSGALEKRMFDIYLGGYHFGHGITTGQSYFSGPLKQYGFADSLLHASTLHSGPLQVADMVVGCCRDFIHWAWKGERRQRIDGLFDLLISHFYCDPQGMVHNYGFKLAKAYQFVVDAKIKEYLETPKVI